MERESLKRMDRFFDDGVRADLRSQRRGLSRGKAGKVGAFVRRGFLQWDAHVLTPIDV
jgi:hypothetical protein